MKKILSLIAACGLLLGSCSKSEPAGTADGMAKVNFTVTAVNSLQSRADINTTGADGPIPTFETVKAYAFMDDGSSNFLYAGTYDLSGVFGDGDVNPATPPSGTITLQGENLIAPGSYKFIAVGRVATDGYTFGEVISPDPFDDFADQATLTGADFETFAAGISTAGVASVIFAGDSGDPTPIEITAEDGASVSIEITRQVAGVFVYLAGIPDEIDGTPVTTLTVRISNANTSVLLSDGTGGDPTAASYNAITIPLSGGVDGVFPGQGDAAGLDVVAGSYLGSNYVLPITGASMSVVLLGAGDVVLKTWDVEGEEGGLAANTLMAIGTKNAADSELGDDNKDDGTTPEDDDGTPNEDDAPQSLSANETLTVTLNANWSSVVDLTLTPQP